MKLLLLHPHLQSGDPMVQSLQDKGSSVLIAGTPQDAMQILRLHAGTVDAAIVHREGASGTDGSGLELLALVRSDPSIADLPMIITSQVWEDPQFAQHQGTPEGVNAYLRWSDVASQIGPTIDQMLGPQAEPQSEPQSLMLAEMPASSISIPTVDLESLTRQLQIPSLTPAPPPAPSPMAPDLSSLLVVPGSMPSGELSMATRSEAGPIELSMSAMTISAPDFSVPTVSAPSVEIADVAIESPSEPEAEGSAESAMPYLFGSKYSRSEIMPVVMGDAVVPGGAAQSPDVATLKHYLELREKDVSALAIQLRETRELLKRAQEDLRISHSMMEDQASKLEAVSRREREFEREKALLTEGVQAEIEQMRFELKTRNDKIRMLQSKVHAGEQEMERLRDRVRSDLRSIKSNEKKLENQLEILKSDTESRIASRNGIIMELKRKLDLTEFNLDLVQDKLVRERERGEDLRAKLVRASQAVRVAGGLLDPPEPAADSNGDASGVDHGASNRKVS